MSATSENNKRIARNTAFLYLRTICVMLVTLYTSRVVLSQLGVEDFGIYNVVGGVVVLFSFLSSAMTAGTQRFLSFELGRNNPKRLHDIFRMSVNIHVLLGIIVLILAESIGIWLVATLLNIPAERMEATLIVYHCAVISFVAVVIQVPYMAAIVSHEKMGVYACVCILDVLAKLGCVFLLSVLLGDKLKWYAMLLAGVAILTCGMYMTYSSKHFKECRYRFIWDKSIFQELVSYSSWNLFGGLASVMSSQGINILLNIFFGPAVNAARGIAFQVKAAMSSLFASFQQSVNPQIVKQYSMGNLDYMHQLIYRSSRYSFFLVLIFVTPVFLETQHILDIWLGHAPAHTVTFIRLVLLTTLVDCMSTPFVTAAQATGKIKKYQAVVGGLLLLILPLSYGALHIVNSPEIVFVIVLLMSAISLGARVWMLRTTAGISIRKFIHSVIFRTTAVLGITASTWIIPYLLPSTPIRLITSIIAGEIVTISAICFVGINHAERTFVFNKISSLKNRLHHAS